MIQTVGCKHPSLCTDEGQNMDNKAQVIESLYMPLVTDQNNELWD